MKLILTIVLIGLISLALTSAKRNRRWRSKSNNLIQQRPSKNSMGLFEKPDFENDISESNEDIEDTTRPSTPTWYSRIWQNAFGRNNPDPDLDTNEESNESVEDEPTGFFASLKPWWKGPNVCNSEDIHYEPTRDGRDTINSFFSFFMTSCHDSGRAYKCTKRSKQNSTTARVHTLTYECCLGFDRNGRSSFGCPKKVNHSDIIITLHHLNASKLAEALVDANMTSMLKKGPITLFAPSDNAMTSGDGQNDISVVVLETSDKMHFARDILQSHIVLGPRIYSSDDFEDEQLLPSASNGVSIRINIFRYPAPFATANCARITSSDHQTTNGYIHVIDRVLTPVKRNLWQMIEDDSRFSIFRSLVDDNIKRRLKDPKEHLTLLSFTDDAFEKLSTDIRQRIRDKNDCLKNLLLHHILPHTICTAAIFDERGYVRNLANRLMNATRLIESISFANQKVTHGDQMAINGVMHIIDSVILTPEMLDTIGALERSGGAGTKFAAAIKINDLSTSVSNSPAITIFVPPSDSIDSLTNVDIRNHIVRQSVFDRFRVVLNRPKTMLTDAGKNISIRFEYDYPSLFDWEAENRLRLHVGCARAEKIISSCEGAIVFLDKPFSLPSKTIYDVLKSKPELSDFVSMIDTARLANDLKGSRFDSTVLAPTNEALTMMRANEKRRLLANPTRLRRFLKEHFILGTKCCNELTAENWLTSTRHTTMIGTQLTSTGQNEESLRIGGARVEECDLGATNGLVHAIDGTVNSRRQGHWSSDWNRFSDLFDE